MNKELGGDISKYLVPNVADVPTIGAVVGVLQKEQRHYTPVIIGHISTGCPAKCFIGKRTTTLHTSDTRHFCRTPSEGPTWKRQSCPCCSCCPDR